MHDNYERLYSTKQFMKESAGADGCEETHEKATYGDYDRAPRL